MVSANPATSSPSSRLRAVRSMNAMSGLRPSRVNHLPGHAFARSRIWKPAEGQQRTGGQHQPQQRKRQKYLPAQPHELIVAVAREGRADPKEDEQAEADLQDEPEKAE